MSVSRPLMVLVTASMSRPLSAPPKNTRFCKIWMRVLVRNGVQH